MIDANIRKLVVDMNMQELRDLQDLVVIAMKRLQATATMMFRPGDRVSFQNSIRETLTGTVMKVNQKTVSVRVGTTTWKVSGTLLRLQETGDGRQYIAA
jgi:small-conductance mechanosensitive channel